MVRSREGVTGATALQESATGIAVDGHQPPPFAEAKFLRAPLSWETRPWELGATMFGLFGNLGLVIAGVGLYSSVAYETAQRTHEFGVRQALGARAVDVGALVVGRAIRYAVPGLAVGLILALISTRWIGPLLFDVSPRDPTRVRRRWDNPPCSSHCRGVGPARRALRVDPVVALRED